MNDISEKIRRITLPLTKDIIKTLKEGEPVLLSGKMLVMRDAAHKIIVELLEKGEPLPIDLGGCCIYYMAPCPPTGGRAAGSAGPTTGKRMDAYAPLLYDEGVIATVGKGERNAATCEAIKRNGAAYFVAVGGAGAYYAECIKEYKVVAYKELLSEAVAEIIVEDFPCIFA